MKMKIDYLKTISQKKIDSFEDIIQDSRLINHLWIELLLNPQTAKICEPYVKNKNIADAFIKAISWYVAFKWFLPKNNPLENMNSKGIISPYKLRGELYREDRRNFLKGILYAKLC